MKQDDAANLNHIINAINQIEHYTRGMSENEFLSRPMVQDAVLRQIEIVDEAARCISTEFQDLHSKVPWAKIIGVCKKLIREDFDVNLPSVWNTVQDDLPLLKQAVKKLV